MAEEINKIENFKFELKRLVYIKVLNNELIEIISENESKRDKREYIFAFDDETKEGVKNKIIPLYFFKNEKKVNKFLLFLDFFF